jgi:dihydroorotase
MMRYLIQNAQLVNEGQTRAVDVRVRDGRIQSIAASLAHDGVETLIDARGKHLLPGMIDDQVHFREPGLEHKGTIGSESRAAVAGGITSFMEMPNTQPPTLSRAALEHKYAIAAESALANHAFYLGASNDNLDDVKRLDPTAACGVKVFMGASTGNMLVDDETILEGIFAHSPTLIATHCEDTPTIMKNLARVREQYGEDIPVELHPVIRDAECCYKSSSLAVELARRHGADLHVLHLTTAREMALFEPGPIEHKKITAEVCVHHLWFDDSRYADLGALIKCNPAVKSRADRDALRRALIEDRLDIIATDHAPHLLSEKAQNYARSPAGLPLVQHALPALLDLVHEGVLDLPTLVHKVAHAPAIRYKVSERGFVREGYFADLVLVDFDRADRIRREDVRYRCGWSPFEGANLRATISHTFVSGHLAYANGAIDESVLGQRLQFNR